LAGEWAEGVVVRQITHTIPYRVGRASGVIGLFGGFGELHPRFDQIILAGISALARCHSRKKQMAARIARPLDFAF
jgi:hypothetical protein